ncbi:MAG: hypothetical protein AAF721_31160 [Myxococcota bacterium]
MLSLRSLSLRCGLATAGLAAGLIGGCVISTPSDGTKPGPCGGKACSQYGYCERGTDQCRCDDGYIGNPYAAFGCQAARPGGDCATTCGLNASCDADAGECVCADGFVAVCGTGDCLALSAMCDGVDDCPNAADERDDVCFETIVMEWVVTDGCDDGLPLKWRLWAADREWVWPSADVRFETPGLSQPGVESIECYEGEVVCFGGSAGEADWGVGASGSLSCEDCCEPCREVSLDYGALACD